MMHRSLTRPQNPPQEIDFHGLQMFQDDVVRELRELTDTVNRQQATISLLIAKLDKFDTLLSWIQTHRPETLQDYKTTVAVASRLSNFDDEIMEKQA